MATAQLERPPIAPVEPHPFHWSVELYYEVSKTGCFEGKRVELIEGEIIEMSPMGSPHWVIVEVVRRALSPALGDHFSVVTQLPITLSEDTEPEPDITVVAGQVEDYMDAHPSSALLIVEVSESSLQYDRQRKSKVYAAAKVQDYWIVDLKQGRLEVRRLPHSTDDGHEYAEVSVYSRGEAISPLFAPSVSIAIADLLPRKPVKERSGPPTNT